MRTPDIEIGAAYVVKHPSGEQDQSFRETTVKATALEVRVPVRARLAAGTPKANGVRMRLEAPVRLSGDWGGSPQTLEAGAEFVVEARLIDRPWDERGDALLAERAQRYIEQDAIREALATLGGPEVSLRGSGADFKRSELAEWLTALTASEGS